MPYINAKQESYEIDKTLKAINDAASTDNNGLLMYIKDGQLAFGDPHLLLNLTELEEEE